jgi:uncharacterized membrane protein YhaH (DUF805 family)
MDIEDLKGWYLKVLRQYADFSGRARRREFWSFALVNFAIAAGLFLLATILGKVLGLLGGLVMLIYYLYSLAVLVPGLAVGVRRLHDTGKSGWFMLLALIPLVGLVLLYFMTIEGDAGPNAYGADPKTADVGTAWAG